MNLHNDKRNITLIAGPCSAESQEQMMQTAQLLMNYCPPQIFRAGAWKARTNIGSFEGYGNQALIWLSEVKKKFNIPVATEVLSPEHVELCIKTQSIMCG
jgi:chorismate mutase